MRAVNAYNKLQWLKITLLIIQLKNRERTTESIQGKKEGTQKEQKLINQTEHWLITKPKLVSEKPNRLIFAEFDKEK